MQPFLKANIAILAILCGLVAPVFAAGIEIANTIEVRAVGAAYVDIYEIVEKMDKYAISQPGYVRTRVEKFDQGDETVIKIVFTAAKGFSYAAFLDIESVARTMVCENAGECEIRSSSSNY